jgi:hypothetical protein
MQTNTENKRTKNVLSEIIKMISVNKFVFFFVFAGFILFNYNTYFILAYNNLYYIDFKTVTPVL